MSREPLPCLFSARSAVAALGALGLLAACSHGPKNREAAAFSVPAVGGPAPNVNSVPDKAPQTPSTKEQRADAINGLVADRENARHTDQPGRSLPVAVRPLSDTPAQTADLQTPPKPEAAPAGLVQRLETPPPSRPSDAGGDAQAPATETAQAEEPSPPPPPPRNTGAMIGPRQASMPQRQEASDDEDNGNDTLQKAALPTTGFRTLTELDTIKHAQNAHLMASLQLTTGSLTAGDRAKLSEASLKQSDTKGVIKVIGRGTTPQDARDHAVLIARELERAGVENDQLFVGFEVSSDHSEVFVYY